MANKNVQQAPGAGYRNILVINMFRWRKKGLRSRARFKLEEIQQGDNIFRPGMTIVDLGAAPGGWSQYAVNHIGQSGRVIACDLLPMDPIVGVDFLQGDFRDENVLKALLGRVGDKKSVLLCQTWHQI